MESRESTHQGRQFISRFRLTPQSDFPDYGRTITDRFRWSLGVVNRIGRPLHTYAHRARLIRCIALVAAIYGTEAAHMDTAAVRALQAGIVGAIKPQ